MDAVIVEVLSRWGQVRSRHRLATFPATLGRAPTCDVILDEADVSATHARLVRLDDGALALEDAGSTNGVRVHGRRVPRVTLRDRTDVRLGSAHLRIVSTAAPAEKTVTFRLSRLDRPSTALVAFGWLAAQVVLDEAGLAAVRVRGVDVLETLVGLTVFCGAWAFAWSLASRVAQGHFRYLGHLTAAMFALATITLTVEVLAPAAGFALRLGLMGRWAVGFLFAAAVAAWTLYHHLARVTSWSSRRLVTVAVALCAAGGLVLLVPQWSRVSRYSAELPHPGKSFPPALLVGPATTPAAVVEELGALAAEVDGERAER